MSDREREEHPAELEPGTPGVPRGWVRHPRERMLITPLVAGVGGLLAFFTVVAIVVWLPIHTFDPPPSSDWAPLSSSALAGRNLFASNGCYVCHSGYSRPQDVREALYFLYPKVSHRATSGAPTSRRTCSARSGPAPTSRRNRAGIRTTGSPLTSTTRATWTRSR